MLNWHDDDVSYSAVAIVALTEYHQFGKFIFSKYNRHTQMYTVLTERCKKIPALFG